MPLILSSIPTDPSLTVLKVSIKQYKGEKEYNKSCSFHASLTTPRPPGPPGVREIPISYYVYWNKQFVVDYKVFGDGQCHAYFCAPHGVQDKHQAGTRVYTAKPKACVQDCILDGRWQVARLNDATVV